MIYETREELGDAYEDLLPVNCIMSWKNALHTSLNHALTRNIATVSLSNTENTRLGFQMSIIRSKQLLLIQIFLMNSPHSQR